MAIQRTLQEMSRRQGYSNVLPTPDLCQQILVVARAEGIAIGTLFIVRRPLLPATAGGYDRESGDLWCHYDATRGEQGKRELVQCLLALLVCVQRRFPVPHTIEEDWEQVSQSHAEAFVLARRWGLADLFSEQERREQAMRDLHHLRCHLAAGLLVGNEAPAVARFAYLALLQVAQQRGWSDAVFADALDGDADPESTQAVLGWDRAHLRERWLVTSQRREGAAPSWGALTLVFGPQAERLLRSALARSARLASGSQAPVQGSAHWFVRVTGETDLAEAMHLVNTWLIHDFPDAAVRLTCWGYGESGTPGFPLRIYRLRLAYEDLEGAIRPPTREVWVLTSSRRGTTVEAAWQQYLLSWLTFADVQYGSLQDGLETVWEVERWER